MVVYRELCNALTTNRLHAYETAFSHEACSKEQLEFKAVDLYLWNAELSGSLLMLMGFYEVVLRNAIAEALECKYGVDWPFQEAFQRSLPIVNGPNFCPRSHLVKVAKDNNGLTGQVIANLKLAFWEHMLTKRHENRIWSGVIFSLFPNYFDLFSGPRVIATEREFRNLLKDHLRDARLIRNRLAHHEPVYKNKGLQSIIGGMFVVIQSRSRSLTFLLKDKRLEIDSLVSANPWTGK